MIKTVTHDTFEAEVIKSDKPVLVDLWAEWCAPCHAMDPAIQAIAEEFQGRLQVAKLNVDENPELAQSLDVMSIPTLLLFKNGRPVERVIGLTTKDRLAGVIKAAIA